jgi:AcrR family transcriptional regulator
MQVSRQDPRSNQRNRTRAALIEAANELMRRGRIPSVAEAAEAASVSRATAYRYFPNQATLLENALMELASPLRPEVLKDIDDPEDFIEFGVNTAITLLRENEAQFRAVLRLSLEQWAQHQAGDQEASRPVMRGGRIPIVEAGVATIRDNLDAAEARRLAIALSLLFGIETLVVLEDIWHLDDDEARDVLRWAGLALIRSAMERNTSNAANVRETKGKPQGDLAHNQ